MHAPSIAGNGHARFNSATSDEMNNEFHPRHRQAVRARLSPSKARASAPRGAAIEAAQYASDHGIGLIDAAQKFGCQVSSVQCAWWRLFPGVPSQLRTPTPVERAVAFAYNHSTSIRRAAAVYGANPQDVCDAYNAKYGTRRQLVGETWRLV